MKKTSLAIILACLLLLNTAQDVSATDIWYGFGDPLLRAQPHGKFPATVAQAMEQGYVATNSDEADVEPILGPEAGIEFTKELSPFTLYYKTSGNNMTADNEDDGMLMLSAFVVTGPRIDGLDVAGNKVVPWSVFEIGNFSAYAVWLPEVTGDNVKMGKMAEIEFPPTVQEAVAAGWDLELGCVENMGGTHHVKTFEPERAFSAMQYSFLPLYDTYGTGLLNGFQLSFFHDPEFPYDTQDFDFSGGPIPSAAACIASACTLPDCLGSGFPDLTSVHVFFSEVTVDPQTFQVTGATCQLGPEAICYADFCSCCGTPEQSWDELRQHCPKFAPEECGAFSLLNFSFGFFDRYTEFFDEESTITLSQAGQYQGPEDIEEYVRFTDRTSPYVDIIEEQDATFQIIDFNPFSGDCTFQFVGSNYYKLNASLVNDYEFYVGYMAQLVYSIPKNNLPSAKIYYTPEFLDFIMGTAFNADGTRSNICDTLTSEHCAEAHAMNGDFTHAECMEQLAALPVTEGDNIYFDGNTQSCRYLHGVFASLNDKHCPHISLAEMEDTNGNLVCRKSAMTQPLDLFSQEEVDLFYAFCQGRPEMQTPTCFKIIRGPDDDPPTAEPPTADPPTADPSTASGAGRLASMAAAWAIIVGFM